MLSCVLLCTVSSAVQTAVQGWVVNIRCNTAAIISITWIVGHSEAGRTCSIATSGVQQPPTLILARNAAIHAIRLCFNADDDLEKKYRCSKILKIHCRVQLIYEVLCTNYLFRYDAIL